MIETRTEELNYLEVNNTLVYGIKKYCDINNIKTLVLGISGGIDSTVVAALAKQTGIPLIGVSMPCSTNKECENDAALLVGKEFCTEFKVCNLQHVASTVIDFCNCIGECENPIPQGNIKARLRMITLYDIAWKNHGIVLDTDNLTEHHLGFWTIHGDDGDFNPIGALWKHEVYDLAKWLKENRFKDSEALTASIELMPTDGNGVSNSDLDQIAPNKTYDDVDEILQAWVGLDARIKDSVLHGNIRGTVFEKLCEKHGTDIVNGVIQRSWYSEYKRKARPFMIDFFNGNILDKNQNFA